MHSRVDTSVRAEETRPPIESCTLPPIHATHALAQLKEVGELILARAARDGNCFPASCLASVQEISVDEASHPTTASLQRIEAVRTQAIDLVTGEHIGGVAGAVVRRGEQIDFTHTAALQAWRENGKWYADEDVQSLASAFQLKKKL